MPNAKTQIDQEYDGPVNVMLTGGRVTSSFRQALFLAAGRSGMTVNEFALRAAAEKLAKAGASFSGVFERGDITPNDNFQRGVALHG